MGPVCSPVSPEVKAGAGRSRGPTCSLHPQLHAMAPEEEAPAVPMWTPVPGLCSVSCGQGEGSRVAANCQHSPHLS